MKKLAFLLVVFHTIALNLNAQEIGTFVDERDLHEYKWTKIGDEIWMAENLAFRTKEGSLGFNGRSDYMKLSGLFYDWEAAMVACPCGWHLAGDDEWEQLASFISKENGDLVKKSDDWDKVGGFLKKDTIWSGTNKYGFSAIPIFINDYGLDKIISPIPEAGGRFWTSFEVNKTKAAARSIYFQSDRLYRFAYKKKGSYSVRCVKNK